MEQILVQLIDFLKTASPFVWSILVKQVYSDGVSSLVEALGFLILCITLYKLGNYGKQQAEKDDLSMWEIGRVFSFIGSGISGLVSFFFLLDGIQRLYNPEFYAIQCIIKHLH